MTSIRARLIFILVVMTAIVWLSAIVWIYASTRAQVEHVLDARLMEAARMVSSLITSQEIDPKRAAEGIANPSSLQNYERQLSCQIWALNGTLIGRSDAAPATPLASGKSGFSDTWVGGEAWRVYSVENAELGVRVLVGDNLKVRDGLVGGVIAGLVLPALLVLPSLTFLIWLCVDRGLAPLNCMAAALEIRPASDLSPLETENGPSEIRTVTRSLNGLFERVTAAREHERNFTAFAAHELRTPIAGLKTQAQIALASQEGETRENALKQIIVGVDRATRLVRQLTDLTAAENGEISGDVEETDVGATLANLSGELQVHNAKSARIVLAGTLKSLRLRIEPTLFLLAARNILENALLHSSGNGDIHCWARRYSNGRIGIVVDDDGPGISDAELLKVRDRFFRGRNKAPIGSGLGLAIVDLALTRAGAALLLSNRPEGGLRAEILIDSGR